ncbi:hypothetical protein [Luteimonas saliphila]|uniref:hypothetical protein n=1 Tax=Luteimonas saliphila TaxID=2804919 RepID=UPI00192DA18E|nr:hypothetical protein [Luteimonas saliphila]
MVSNTYTLAPWADVLVANDHAWWRKHPEAHQFSGRKFSANEIKGVERAKPCTFGSRGNSGVLALDVVRNLGAKRVILLGLDMHGTHFFGPYKNGCTNTTEAKRRIHVAQFKQWRRRNPGIEVTNCTEGSALTCFPMARLDEVDCHMAVE